MICERKNNNNFNKKQKKGFKRQLDLFIAVRMHSENFWRGTQQMPLLDGNAQDVKSGKQCEQCSVEIAVAQLVERVSRMEQQRSSLIRLRQTS